MLTERKKTIRELEKLAESVHKLKKEKRQRRPIVIEFSGSPKSGKTSCINSLQLFLKRNGFSVKVIQEYASSCPVSNKHSPIFNIWTACKSIAGILGSIGQNRPSYDVLLVDRGLFDAASWFEWQYDKKAIEGSEKEIIDSFLTMNLLAGKIDIVFAFSVDPEESIKREYANLLTEKPGSIMNRDVLDEYLKALKTTINKKSKYFHKIIEIDTTDFGQDDAGKCVTKSTLTEIKDLLMERIMYFEISSEMENRIRQQRVHEYQNLQNVLVDQKFGPRDEVEKANEKIQPIPIAVITNHSHDRVLVVRKNQKHEKRSSVEYNKTLLYVGGHPRKEDTVEARKDDVLAVYRSALTREINEEIGLSIALEEITPFYIYTPDSDVSARHIAVCFVVELDDLDNLRLTIDPYELTQNKGKSKSGTIQLISDLVNMSSDEFESWSHEIVRRCFGGGEILAKQEPQMILGI